MKYQPRWKIFKDFDGFWRFRLRASNGEIILQSEGYANRGDALQSIELIKSLAGKNIPIIEDDVELD